MPNPFSKGASIFVKIRTNIEFFQSGATVAHSTEGVGMTVDSSSTKDGLRVRMVFPGSPAQKAGIGPGDPPLITVEQRQRRAHKKPD